MLYGSRVEDLVGHLPLRWHPRMLKKSWQTEAPVQVNRLTLSVTKPESLPLKAVRALLCHQMLARNAVRMHQRCSKWVVISVFLLGGPHIKVQFQALHLMIMALPEANRDTAQVCCIDLMVCHWFLLVRGNGSGGKMKTERTTYQPAEPAANPLP